MTIEQIDTFGINNSRRNALTPPRSGGPNFSNATQGTFEVQMETIILIVNIGDSCEGVRILKEGRGSRWLELLRISCPLRKSFSSVLSTFTVRKRKEKKITENVYELEKFIIRHGLSSSDFSGAIS